MSSDLQSWVQGRLVAVYSAHTDDEFTTAYEQAFSSNVQMDLGQGGSEPERVTVSGAEAQTQFTARVKAAAEASTTVKWKSTSVAGEEKADESGNEAGTVEGTFVVTRNLKFRIRAAPAQMLDTVQFQAQVEPDPSVTSDDKRRIVKYTSTSTSKQAPIVLAHLPVQPKKEL